MRPDIPWNVAGIPPEAREAARVAARKEGLSVGEWMTRRILHSFSETGDEVAVTPSKWPSNGSTAAPAAQRRPAPTPRDTEDMLAHVARSETESGDAFRRIEEQLRGVARRLEQTERSQSENNRAMSKAATEVNIATREQAQAFDQLGASVVGLAERVARIERATTGDNMRDAVKGLHTGLSRLADQITATANHSASQISALATNLEAVASRVGETRAQSDEVSHLVGQRLAEIDERMRLVERAAHSNIDAIHQTISSIETLKDEDVSALRRDSDNASAISRLEDHLTKLEAKNPDPTIDRRLTGIEQGLSDIAQHIESKPHSGVVEDTLKVLAERIEAAEARQSDAIAELRLAVDENSGRLSAVESISRPKPGDIGAAFAPAEPAPFDAPPFAQTPHRSVFGAAAPSPFEASESFSVAPPPLEEEAPALEAKTGFDEQPFATSDPFASVESTPTDDYLSAARRSARAAAQTEADHVIRGTFSWATPAQAPMQAEEVVTGGPESTRNQALYWVGAIALLALLAIVVGWFSQRLSAPVPHASSIGALFDKPTTKRAHAVVSVPAPVAPASASPQDLAAAPPPSQTLKPSAPLASPVPRLTPIPLRPESRATPKPQRVTEISPLDKLKSLASSGNSKAQLLIGLKYLDGDGLKASDNDAAKWLERAAEQGQPVAQYRLGTLYERGRGMAADPTKAVHWYTLAAQAGNRKAMHNLAVALASGSGTTKNLAQAALWFSKAAALGLPDSEFNLAVLYERGMGVPQSLLDAYKWYAIAAAAGDAESKSRIDALATQISADDRSAAQHAADAFKPMPLAPDANSAPTMKDVAG